ncbi:hypothetical protein OGM63_12490, partial [Plectonema radiosum NIES-515]
MSFADFSFLYKKLALLIRCMKMIVRDVKTLVETRSLSGEASPDELRAIYRVSTFGFLLRFSNAKKLIKFIIIVPL